MHPQAAWRYARTIRKQGELAMVARLVRWFLELIGKVDPTVQHDLDNATDSERDNRDK